ncbi:MAG: MOP flippase family protein [Acidobacteriaceae bacterium]|nr:MOP flippase family protein [Acidobacteriaceae bacterium]
MSTAETPKVTGLTRRALAGSAWSTLAMVGRQVLTVASLATVARVVGPGAYGLMGMATVIIAFISNFRDLGTAVAIVQRPAISRTLLSSLFWINALLGVLMCLTVALTAPLAGRFFHQPILVNILRLLSLSLLVASAGVVHNAILTRDMSFRILAFIDFGSALASYLVALVCAYAGLGVWSLVFASLTASVTTTIPYWMACGFRPRFEFHVNEVKSIAKFSSNLSAFGFVNYACRNADNAIVGRVLGTVPLGFYQMAYNMMLTPLQNISSVIAQVLFPAFSRIQDDDERFRSAYVRACMLTGLLTFPVMAGLAVVANPLVRALLGTKWLGTIPIFEILAPVGLVQSVMTTVGIIYQAKARTDLMFRWSLVTLVTVVTAFLIGVRFGAAGVAAAYAIAFLGVLTYPSFAIPFRLIGLRVRDFGMAMVPQLLLTLCMAGVCCAWLWLMSAASISNAWAQLLSTVLLGVFIYGGGVLLLRPRVLEYAEEVMETSEHRTVLKGLSWMQRLRVGA